MKKPCKGYEFYRSDEYTFASANEVAQEVRRVLVGIAPNIFGVKV